MTASRIARELATLAGGFFLGMASYACLGRATGTQTLHYRVVEGGPSLYSSILSGIAGALILYLLSSAYERRRKALEGEEAPSRLFAAAAPLLALLPIGVVPPQFPSLLFYVAAVSFVCYRILAIWPGPLPTERIEVPRLAAWGALSALVAFSIGYAYLLQIRTYDSLYLGWDWEVYFNVVDNTLKGKWFFSDFLGRNYFGQHFSPGMVLILAPFIWLSRAVQTLFAVNAVALYIGAFGLYAFARAKGCGRGESLALATAFILHPSLSSLSTCVFYGFHDTNLSIALVIFFFLALEKGWKAVAIALLLLSLGVKETAAIFWAFTGLVIAMDKPRRTLGLAIAAGSAAWFLLVTKAVMPLLAQGAQYEFIGVYYGNLGSSMTEIALSPLMKPAAFWGQLFRANNLFFLALFMLPALVTSCNKARCYLGFAGILLFTFVKDSDETCTINFSYQAEILALLYAASVLGFAKLAGFEGAPERAPLTNGLGAAGMPSRKLAHAALAASLLAAALCFQFFALGCPFGKNIWAKSHMAPIDFTQDLKRWEESIPPGVPLTASMKIGAHFLTRNVVHNLEGQPDEYVLLDLNDGVEGRIEDYRRRLIAGACYSLIRFETVMRHTWLLFKREIPATPPQAALFKTQASRWEGLGSLLKQDSLASVRIVEPEPGSAQAAPGFKPVSILIRLDWKSDCDLVFDFKIKCRQAGPAPAPYLRVPFAQGALPAYMAEPGDCFQLDVQIPDEEGVELSVDVLKAPAPDFSKPPFAFPPRS